MSLALTIIRSNLINDARVLRMSKLLKIDRWSVVGRLSSVWDWISDQSDDGHIIMEPEMIDDFINFKGFAEAMRDVEWLQIRGKLIIFPKWKKYNDPVAKARLLEAEAKRLRRAISDNDTEIEAATFAVRKVADSEKLSDRTTTSPALDACATSSACPTFVPGTKNDDENANYIINNNLNNNNIINNKLINKLPEKTKVRQVSDKVEKPPDPRHREIMLGWDQGFLKTFGEKYLFNGGRDGIFLKRFLSSFPKEKTSEDFLGVAKKAWERSKKPFSKFCKNAGTLKGFCDNYSSIILELSEQKNENKKQATSDNQHEKGF